MPDQTVIEHNKHVVRRIYEACINLGQLDHLSDLISEDYEGPQGQRGVAGYRSTIVGLRAGFPDVHFTLEDVFAEGDKVAVRWRWEGTHSGQFQAFAPTHRRATNSAIAIYRLKDGKVIRNWLEVDRLGVLQQLGIIPRDLRATSRGN